MTMKSDTIKEPKYMTREGMIEVFEKSGDFFEHEDLIFTGGLLTPEEVGDQWHGNTTHVFKNCVFRGTVFDGCDLTYVRFENCDLSGAFFRNATLSHAVFDDVKASRAFFDGARLDYARFVDTEVQGASFGGATLYHTELTVVYVSRATTFIGANMRQVKLNGIVGALNTSGMQGLLDPWVWLTGNFKFDPSLGGFLVFKAHGVGTPSHESTPETWVFEENKSLREVADGDAFNPCGAGVNFGTARYVWEKFGKFPHDCKTLDFWVCLLDMEGLAGLVVPYDNDGKARTTHLRLLHKISREEVRYAMKMQDKWNEVMEAGDDI